MDKDAVGQQPAGPKEQRGGTTVPPVPTPEHSNTPEHHEAMGRILSQTIERGKQEVPDNPSPLVCKPRELESWRVFKIMSEFVEGFELIRKYGLAVSFFGTARVGFEEHFYKEATDLAGKLAKAGFAVITGGSSGVMEAANKGAFEAGGASVGLNIRLDQNQGLNTYLTDSYTFEHFFVRKVMLAFASEVYVFFPGGYGTMDEFFEIVTLVQTGKIRKVPIVVFGKEYWEPLIAFMQLKFLEEHAAIDAPDLELFFVADTVDEAYEFITKNVQC
ncbi:MAG: hypothetical protein QOE22_686 [Candidatus Parcubacteria bacterium]|jgi:uncharacterized protein (TIGR00730 family)|nr:hypothetical protein [Candidatus Parcubacteria bacterium]